jgi:5-methylcytosine-specific restriction endonuclease McrA
MTKARKQRRRWQVAARSEWRCAYCGFSLVASASRFGMVGGATIDHIVPRSHGGTDALENLVLACWGCNSSKCNRDIEEWRLRESLRRIGAPGSFTPVQMAWLDARLGRIKRIRFWYEDNPLVPLDALAQESAAA